MSLAKAGWREYKRGVDTMSEYALRYLPAHLQSAEDRAGREELLNDIRFLLASGDLYVRLGVTGPARERYDQAVVVCRRHVKVEPDNRSWQRDLSTSYNKLGEVVSVRDSSERPSRPSGSPSRSPSVWLIWTRPTPTGSASWRSVLETWEACDSVRGTWPEPRMPSSKL